MQHLFEFFCSFLQFLFRLLFQRQIHRDYGAAALGVGDIQSSAVALDDLIADRQTDAAAPGLG